MASRMHPQAKRLLDAHTDYILGQLSGAPLEAMLENTVDLLLAQSARITLNEAVTRKMIKDTVRGYAVELELAGAIPELVGDIARTLYAHPIHETTTLNDLLPDHLFTEFLDKILDMRELHEWVVHEAVANPVYAALATELVMEGIRSYLPYGSEQPRLLPGKRKGSRLAATSVLRSFLPMIEETLEENLRNYIQKSLHNLLAHSENFLLGLMEDEKVRNVALEAWDLLKDRRVADFREGVSSLDIEEFFVIGYEAWRALRATPFYGALIDSGIDAFFDKYGDSSLREILDEMGITAEIALRDANRFAPPVLAMLHEKGLLEPMVRQYLSGFYHSPALADILADEATTAPATVKTPAARKPAPAAPAEKSAKPAATRATTGKRAAAKPTSEKQATPKPAAKTPAPKKAPVKKAK
jgi:hypothetical protein